MIQFIVQYCIYFWLALTTVSDSNALSYAVNTAKAEPELSQKSHAILSESALIGANEWQFLLNCTSSRRSIRRTEGFSNLLFCNVVAADIFFKNFFESVFQTQQDKSVPSLYFIKLLNGCYATLYRFHLF